MAVLGSTIGKIEALAETIEDCQKELKVLAEKSQSVNRYCSNLMIKLRAETMKLMEERAQVADLGHDYYESDKFQSMLCNMSCADSSKYGGGYMIHMAGFGPQKYLATCDKLFNDYLKGINK